MHFIIAANQSTFASYLNKPIDSDSGGVPKHIGQIASSVDKWEGDISDGLELTTVDVAAIKAENPFDHILQT